MIAIIGKILSSIFFFPTTMCLLIYGIFVAGIDFYYALILMSMTIFEFVLFLTASRISLKKNLQDTLDFMDELEGSRFHLRKLSDYFDDDFVFREIGGGGADTRSGPFTKMKLGTPKEIDGRWANKLVRIIQVEGKTLICGMKTFSHNTISYIFLSDNPRKLDRMRRFFLTHEIGHCGSQQIAKIMKDATDIPMTLFCVAFIIFYMDGDDIWFAAVFSFLISGYWRIKASRLDDQENKLMAELDADVFAIKNLPQEEMKSILPTLKKRIYSFGPMYKERVIRTTGETWAELRRRQLFRQMTVFHPEIYSEESYDREWNSNEWFISKYNMMTILTRLSFTGSCLIYSVYITPPPPSISIIIILLSVILYSAFKRLDREIEDLDRSISNKCGRYSLFLSGKYATMPPITDS